jgi:hypothetical protein
MSLALYGHPFSSVRGLGALERADGAERRSAIGSRMKNEHLFRTLADSSSSSGAAD